MARARNPNRERAYEIYRDSGGTIDLVEIASQLNLSPGTVRGWKSKDDWEGKLNGTFPKNTERSKRSKGGQPGNKNAVGHGGTGPPGNSNAVGNCGGAAPIGNKNAVTHGAYETIYSQALPEEERAIFDSIPDSDDLNGEIRLLRLKLSRLLQRKEIRIYDMFGGEHKREITEEERERGINSCIAEIRKLIKTKKQIELAEAKVNHSSSEREDEVAALLRGLVDDLNE